MFRASVDTNSFAREPKKVWLRCICKIVSPAHMRNTGSVQGTYRGLIPLCAPNAFLNKSFIRNTYFYYLIIAHAFVSYVFCLGISIRIIITIMQNCTVNIL